MFNRVQTEETILNEDMLLLFWTCEGTSTTKASPNTTNQEDKKALQIFEETVKHNGERYEFGLPWKQNIQLPNNYFLAKAQLRSSEKRLNEDRQLADTYNSLIQNEIVKVTLRRQTENLPQHATNCGIFLIIQYSTNRRKGSSCNKCSIYLQRTIVK